MKDGKGFYGKLLNGLLLVLTIWIAFPAQAALAYTMDIQNPYSDKMSVAIIDYEDAAGTWRTQGWFTVNPLSTRRIVRSDSTAGKYVYLYVKTSEAAWTGAGVPSSVARTVTSNAFKYYQGESCPPGPNRRQEIFAKYQLEDGFLYWSPE